MAEWDWLDTGGIIQDGQPLTFEDPNATFEPWQPPVEAEVSPSELIGTPTAGPISTGLPNFTGGAAPMPPEQAQTLVAPLLQGDTIDTLGTNAKGEIVDLRTGNVIGTDPGQQPPDDNQKTWLKQASQMVKDNPVISAALLSLGLGGVGMLAGKLFAPTPPKLQMPNQVQSPTAALGANVLAGAAAGQGAPPQSLTAPGVGSVLAGNRPPVDLSGLGPSSAGVGADLTTLVRNAIAGQRNIADTGLGASARELATQSEQAPAERDVRLNALNDVGGLTRPTATLAPTLASGLMFSNATQNTMNAAPQPGQTIAPALYEDPIRIAMARQLEHVLGGDLPTPELDRQFKEEEQNIRNQLLRSNGPGYATSSVGIETLQKMRESQQIRREKYKMEVINSLGGQQQSRRQFDITQPETQFTGRLGALAPNELQRAQFAENVQGQRLGQATNLSQGFGRTPVPQNTTTLTSLAPSQSLLGIDAGNRSADQLNQLNNAAALEAFKAGGQNSADTAKGIASLFTGAAGAAIGANRPTPQYTLASGAAA